MDHGLSTMDKCASSVCTDEWRVVVNEAPRSAVEQMACDERAATEAQPSIRLFTWHPGISLGWKQPRPAWCEGGDWTVNGLERVERPTGGGIAFHGSDVSIAVAIPRALGDSLRTWMRLVCQSAASLCEAYGARASCLFEQAQASRIAYCLTERSPYAVLVNGRKIAGFAARRYPHAWLIQGSLLVNPLPAALRIALPAELWNSLSARAVSLSEAVQTPIALADVAHRWAEILLLNISQKSNRFLSYSGQIDHQFLQSEN